ncbi:acyl carrier protein [Ideonella sp.]|jgi:acyl carrier protein|uniref:acyl carrier protein n=1 Tax=Ideonella sp. TaxID=1929293 RepID=UPI0037BE7D79
MSDVAKKIYEIVSSYAIKKSPEDVANAERFEDLALDSVGLMAILDEIEEELGVKLDQDPNINITVPEFVQLIESLVAAKNA